MKKIADITDKNYIHIAVGEELKNKLIEEATKKGLSLNAYVRMLLLDIIDLEEEK